jgi:hypothetical protein
MSTRERRPQEQTVPGPSGEPEPAHTTEARDAGDAFLRAADAALDRALSGSPEDFLRQNRQLGGQ